MMKQRDMEYKSGSKRRGVLNTLTLLVAALFLVSLLTRCANIGSPSGGPRDTLPPVILNMTPDNFSTNTDIHLKKIYVEFDEFVTIKDQHKHFYTSPQMTYKPQMQTRGRGIVITLRDTLQENTTYSLNFGSSIQDNNEGNPLNSMRYVFSTGDEIDSMMMSGYTENSFGADSVGRTFILFFPADSLENIAEYDSTIFNKTPTSIARAESNGIFLAQNIKPIPYQIYAYEDSNDNQIYDPGVDMIGFVDGFHNPLEMDEFAIWFDTLRKYVVAEPQLHFRMFLDERSKRQVLTTNERPTQHKVILGFGAPHPQIDSIIFDSIPQDRLVVEYLSDERDSLAIWIKDRAKDKIFIDGEQMSNIPDTLRGRIVYHRHDSINELVPHTQDLRLLWRIIETKEQEQERVRLEKEQERAKADAEANGVAWEPPVVPNPFKMSFSTTKDINPLKSIDLKFEYPVENFNMDSVKLLRTTKREAEYEAERHKRVLDSKDSVAIANYRPYIGTPLDFKLERDTMNHLLWRLSCEEWGDYGDSFTLSIAQGTIVDILSQSNDAIINNYSLLNEADFSSIKLNIAEDTTTSSSYIVELLNETGNAVLERKIGVEAGQTIFKYIPEGNVMLRITQDLNNNGEWDSGSLILRRSPERTQYISASNGDNLIATKKNWEVEIDVEPETLFKIESTRELADRLDKQEQRRIATLCKDLECKDPTHTHDHNHSGDGKDGHHSHSHIH